MGLAKLDLVFFSFILCHLFLLLNPAYSSCQKPFRCRNFTMEFPFSDFKNPGCGLIMVDNCHSEHEHPRIVTGDSGFRYNYTILNMIPPNKLVVHDPDLQYQLKIDTCYILKNVTLSKSPSISSTISNRNLTLFTCYNQTSIDQIEERFANYTSRKCGGATVYYRTQQTGLFAEEISGIAREYCPMIQLPMKSNQDKDDDLFKLLEPDFILEWNVTEDCHKCYHGGGQCLSSSRNEFQCKYKEDNKVKLILIIAGSVAALLILLCSLISYLVWLRKKRSNGSYLLSRNISSNPSSKSDIEGGSFYFGIPIFSYSELEKATNFFDPSKELGDGGFGTVYYGKLGDGREVAIKRLYEHNYKRVEQFLNEIKILTCLRHPNLVSLYGCTSRRSRELLLVYEYISNGTVADHLHGERAKEAPLTWPVRMSIAIETASALAYLHNSDIIHRDVKTNNILLDSNFCVKVADFGLSRLFPTDVTHISTAPQGTPGYVDPEYHQCYQLTDKSDVYSFGVVLAELISSMPAVDISRHRHEINLANLALNRIQRCAFDELIDPSLGYDSDPEVTRMTTSVAELAFRCLQLEKDMRPCMDEVVCFLKGIQGGEDCNFEQMKEANGNRTAPRKIPPSPETDEAVLLKNKDFKSSPTAVTDTWVSSDSTTTSSIG